MSFAAEFEAAIPEPQTILGLRLLPLSLGRYQILKRFDCSFVADQDREISLEDVTGELFFALLVCGLPVAEFEFLLDHPRQFQKEARRFGKQANKIIKSTKGFNVLQVVHQFREWLNRCSEPPWVILSYDDMKTTTMAHWATSIEVTLRSKVNWDDHKIDEHPLAEALMHFFKYAEGEGMVRLYDPETYQSIQTEAKANGEALAKMLKELNHGS